MEEAFGKVFVIKAWMVEKKKKWLVTGTLDIVNFSLSLFNNKMNNEG